MSKWGVQIPSHRHRHHHHTKFMLIRFLQIIITLLLAKRYICYLLLLLLLLILLLLVMFWYRNWVIDYLIAKNIANTTKLPILIYPREINFWKWVYWNEVDCDGNFKTNYSHIKILTRVTVFKICCKLQSHIHNFTHMCTVKRLLVTVKSNQNYGSI